MVNDVGLPIIPLVSTVNGLILRLDVLVSLNISKSTIYLDVDF